MTLEATSNPALVPKTADGPVIHPRWVRVTHWINALAILMMIGSGWQIYDASPLFRFVIFRRSSRSAMARRGAVVAFRRHVAAGHQWHRLRDARHRHRPLSPQVLPIRPRDVVRRLFAALRGQLPTTISRSTTRCKRLLYVGVILAGVVIVLSGLSIWKPVQLNYLTSLFGGYDSRPLRPLLRHGIDRGLFDRPRRRWR